MILYKLYQSGYRFICIPMHLQKSFKSLDLEFRDAKSVEIDSSIILPAKSVVC